MLKTLLTDTGGNVQKASLFFGLRENAPQDFILKGLSLSRKDINTLREAFGFFGYSIPKGITIECIPEGDNGLTGEVRSDLLTYPIFIGVLILTGQIKPCEDSLPKGYIGAISERGRLLPLKEDLKRLLEDFVRKEGLERIYEGL